MPILTEDYCDSTTLPVGQPQSVEEEGGFFHYMHSWAGCRNWLEPLVEAPNGNLGQHKMSNPKDPYVYLC